MSELQSIMDEIVVIQSAITPPTNEKAIVAYDEPPAQFGLPAFINVEQDSEFGLRNPRQITHRINMYLLFAPTDQKYSVRTRRKWVEAVLTAFQIELGLNGTVTQALITRIDYQPMDFNGTEYVAATFELAAEEKTAVTYAA